MKKIKSISKVSFGINPTPSADGDLPCILSGSISSNGEYSPSVNTLISSQSIKSSDQLQAGDILFAAKGPVKFPYVLKERDLPAVASSVFFVITVRQDRVVPEYFAWCLMLPKIRHQLEMMAEGSTIKSVSIRDFRLLSVPVPPLPVQKKIISLQQLQKEYEAKTRRIAELRVSLHQEISNQLVKPYYE
ncbi:MAG: restriction endonuclease subunit S [Balneolales bacterium]|nr:restriction endonuclease subunit S [Balneolales bacterium]